MRTVAALALLLLGACATYKDELGRAQTAAEESQHDRALTLFRRLEQDFPRLDEGDQVRYAYLRGMTDYRVGYRAEARHWLAVADAADKLHPGALTSEWKTKLTEALTELNEKVFVVGGMRLTNVPDPSDPPEAPKEAPAKETPAKPTP